MRGNTERVPILKRTEAACSSEHTEQNGGVGHAVLECDLRELVVGQNRKTSAPHAEAVDAADNRGQWRAEPDAVRRPRPAGHDGWRCARQASQTSWARRRGGGAPSRAGSRR
jgi:hypothetical protein